MYPVTIIDLQLQEGSKKGEEKTIIPCIQDPRTKENERLK